MTPSPRSFWLATDDSTLAQTLVSLAGPEHGFRQIRGDDPLPSDGCPDVIFVDTAAASVARLVTAQASRAVKVLITDENAAAPLIASLARVGAHLALRLPLTETTVALAVHDALDRAELQAARDEAERLKRAFIDVASHELRSPLTALLGLAHLAMRSPVATPSLTDKLKRIYAAGERLSRLDDELVSMLAAGQGTLVRAPSEQPVASLVEAAVEAVGPFVALRHQQVSLVLDDNLGTLWVDAVRMRDSLDHLLMNAIKFTPDAGQIQVRASRNADRSVSIAVRDSGIGIGPEGMRHLFEPFFTEPDVSRHCSGRYEFGRRGVGLGLSVVKAFALAHGGEVRAESEEGRGSTFTLRLEDPAARPACGRGRLAESA